MTLEEIRSHFKKSCRLSSIHRMLAKLGYSYKKTLKESEQERVDVKQNREAWGKLQKNLPIERLVFLDETGAKTNLTSLYGRAIKGRPCNDHASDGRWERTSIPAAIRINAETCSMVFDGALDGKIFNVHIEKGF